MTLTITFLYIIPTLLLLTMVYLIYRNDHQIEETILILGLIPFINIITIVSGIVFIIIELHKDKMKEKMKNLTYVITHKRLTNQDNNKFFNPYVKIIEK